MKQPIRYFSIGLLTASIIMLFFLIFFNDQSQAIEEVSIEEMIEAVQEDGYRVLSESDYISLAVNGNQTEADDTEKNDDKEETNETNQEDKQAEDDQDEEVFTYTLHVKPNMLAPEVSELLEENKIIDDAAKFSKYLDDEGYSKYIQQTKHELSSEMSSKEIAEELTKYK